MRRPLPALLVAVGFLTVVPVRAAGWTDPRTIGRSIVWFPVVGLLIGCALAAVDRLAVEVFPPVVAAGLVITAGAALTGALHLDGLADAADGVFGGRTPERRLEIMRDSRVGSYGVVAVALALLLLSTGLASIDDSDRWRTLLVAPMLSRAGIVLAIVAFPYVRPSGLGRTFKDNASNVDAITAAVVTLLVSILILRGVGAILWLSGGVVTLAAGWYFTRRLGGLTGDTFGAIAVVDEIVLILVVVAMQSS